MSLVDGPASKLSFFTSPAPKSELTKTEQTRDVVVVGTLVPETCSLLHVCLWFVLDGTTSSMFSVHFPRPFDFGHLRTTRNNRTIK